MKILEIDSLTKQYASVRALNGISFSVEEGSICGLLGPNGAGKTTLLRIISAILLPDSGSVKIDGQEHGLHLSRLIGYMPEERGLYDSMRVEDQIMYFGRLKGADPKELRATMEEYLTLFNLQDDRKRRIKELSKGNQQKVQFVATMVHRPRLVILDEPFSGFDPINSALLQQVIEKLHSEGTTIILSSHNMPSVEEMCDNIVLVNHGNLVLSGALDDIKEANRDESSLLLTTRKPLNLPLLLSGGPIVSAEPIPAHSHRKGFGYQLRKREDVSNGEVLSAVALQGEVIHFEEKLPTLAEIFIARTAGSEPKEENVTA